MKRSSIENVRNWYERGIKNIMAFINSNDDFSVTAKKIEQEKDTANKFIDDLFDKYEITESMKYNTKNYIDHSTKYNIKQALKIYEKGGVRY